MKRLKKSSMKWKKINKKRVGYSKVYTLFIENIKQIIHDALFKINDIYILINKVLFINFIKEDLYEYFFTGILILFVTIQAIKNIINGVLT